MGQAGDDFFDAMELRDQDLAELYRKGIWITARGEQIPVRRMKDSHLLNAIRMLYRNEYCGTHPSLEMLEKEARRRGIEP